LRRLVPPHLELDTFDGQAYVSVVFLLVDALHLRGLPAIAGLDRFAQVNVRTYVRHAGPHGDRTGVYFLSIDGQSRIAAWAARLLFGMPFEHAHLAMTDASGHIWLSGTRDGQPLATVDARYRPRAAPRPLAPGTLEAF